MKLQKTVEIKSLGSNKQQTSCRWTYLEVSKWGKRYDWCFEGETTAKVKCDSFSGYKQIKKGVLGLFRC